MWQKFTESNGFNGWFDEIFFCERNFSIFHTDTKKICQITYVLTVWKIEYLLSPIENFVKSTLVFSVVKTLLSRIFSQKSETVDFINFHTVLLVLWLISRKFKVRHYHNLCFFTHAVRKKGKLSFGKIFREIVVVYLLRKYVIDFTENWQS